jgi:cadherin 5 type 2 (VE-cadherin)
MIQYSISSTEPNTPGKFIVWFRNETTLLVLWQPPYPAGIYTHYKVSIDPMDALDSTLYVEKEGEPPGPAQAAFKGLIPGTTTVISVFGMDVIICHDCCVNLISESFLE